MEKTSYQQPITQEVLVNKFVDIIEKKGGLFQKTAGVHAVVAKGGEHIITVTKDGKETENISFAGDFIITNDTSSMESYIIPAFKFNDRYVPHPDITDFYVPNEKARIFALEVSEANIRQYNLKEIEQLIINPEHPVFIHTPWNEDQAVRLNDYLACPITKNEVYRIARHEFDESYTLAK